MIDPDKFLQCYIEQFGTFNTLQHQGLLALVGFFNADGLLSVDPRFVAYALATIYWETAQKFQPIPEIGKGVGHSYGKPDPITQQVYYGRGYVQLTWKANYQEFTNILRIDLINHPDLALEPATAYKILSFGMRRGTFTGKTLLDFIHGDTCDYLGAREIINGNDRASIIAGFATKFEHIVRTAQQSLLPNGSTPNPTT